MSPIHVLALVVSLSAAQVSDSAKQGAESAKQEAGPVEGQPPGLRSTLPAGRWELAVRGGYGAGFLGSQAGPRFDANVAVGLSDRLQLGLVHLGVSL